MREANAPTQDGGYLRKEAENIDWVRLIALVLSILGLALHGVNFISTWRAHVTARAELSIVVESFTYSSSEGYFRVNISGIVINVGARNTTIERIDLKVKFTRKGNGIHTVHWRPTVNSLGVDFVKENLAENEGTSFTVYDRYYIHGADPEDFYKLIFAIVHDDGKGILEDSVYFHAGA